MLIRPGTLADAETIVAHRRAMFYEMGHRDEHALATMSDAFRPWLARMMRDVSKEFQKINSDALRKDLMGIVALSAETTSTGFFSRRWR